MLHGLWVRVPELLQSEVGYIFDELVVNDEVIDIHNKHIEHLFVFGVVATHFVERRL